MSSSSPSNRNPPVDGGGEENTMTDVTKLNFLEQSNDLIRRLPTAAWIAVDEEMTGISLPNTKRPAKDESPAKRYSTLKQVPERYSIIQLGICLFEEAGTTTSPQGIETMQFHVRRYKFTLFPADNNHNAREITFNPSSIHFLAKNKMDFNHMVHSGIPYVPKGAAEYRMERFHEKQLQAAKELESPSLTNTTPNRRLVQLTRDEDKRFHARSMANLREWLDAAIPQHHHNNNNNDDNNNEAAEGACMLLPPCNSFLRRALYESIEKEYPNLIVETSESSQIRVWRLNEQEKKQRRQRLLRKGWEKMMLETVGVYRVFLALTKACNGTSAASQAEHMMLAPTVEDAMREVEEDTAAPGRKIPLIVHNGLQDLFFLLTHFHDGTLPESWPEAKLLIHSYFPVIYDTKCMASQYAPRENSRAPTYLSAVYEQTIQSHPHLDRVFQANNQQQEQQQEPSQEQEHDAGWDAYMTGATYCGLAYAIHDSIRYPATSRSNFQLWNCSANDDAIGSKYGRNKLHFHLSPFTIDLESPYSDPLGNGMSTISTFQVGGIDATVSTRDIVRCLTGMSNSRGDRVNYEIIWIDDTSFLAGAMLPNCQDERQFRDHGKIVLQALRDTFSNGETITSLEESTATSGERGDKQSSGVWNLWGILGKTKKRSALIEAEAAGRANKRRRMF